MITRMTQTAILIAAVGMSAAAMAAYPTAELYTDAVINTWTGSDSENPTLWNTPGNWSLNAVPVTGTDVYVHVDGYDDVDGKSGIRGVYAKFANAESVLVTATNNAPNAEAFQTRGVIVEAGAGKVTIQRSPGWYSSGITLGRNNNRPALINYSSNHVIFDIRVKFGTVSYGHTGVLPGGDYLRELDYTGTGDPFHFYAGDPDRSDYENTSLIESTADFGSHEVLVEANHILEVTGTLTASNLKTVNSGSIVLQNATVTVSGGLSGNITVKAGVTTINHGEADIDLSGMTFEKNALLVLNGTGTVTKNDAVEYPILNNLVTYSGSSEVRFMNDWTQWSDSVVAHGGSDYLVDARKNNIVFRTSDQTAGDFTFPAEKLVMLGGSASNKVRIYHKCGTLEVTNLVMMAYTSYQTALNSLSTGYHTFSGTMTIVGGEDSDSADAVVLLAEQGRSFVLKETDAKGRFAGDGAVKLTNNSATGNAHFHLNVDSPDFTGTMQINGNRTFAYFNSACGVGGNPATLKQKGLEIAYDATVEFSNESAIVVDQPNRGLYIRKNDSTSGGTLKLAADLTWMGPVSFSASDVVLTKTGEGALILDGTNITAVGTIAVRSGSLVAANPYAAGGIAVTDATGTLYSLSAPADGSRVVAAQPLLFIPGASASTSAEDNIGFVTGRGWKFSSDNYGLKNSWKVVLTQTEVDGGVLVSAGAKKPGLAVILR